MAYPHHIRIFTLSGTQYLIGSKSLDEWLYEEEKSGYKLQSIYANFRISQKQSVSEQIGCLKYLSRKVLAC